MNIEDQVTSLELSKKLSTLGVKQNSLFYWVKAVSDWNLTAVITDKDKMYFQHSILDILPMEYCSAFTVAELGNMLPGYSAITTYRNKDNNYYCRLGWIKNIKKTNTTFDLNEANARAKMLIYLIENGYIKNEN